ncbi:MAG: hypothetical protein MPJ24_02080 [Pirellulaceae bacterium]|nr:hypothetical protein [Pirellulaceae bacterium]
MLPSIVYQAVYSRLTDNLPFDSSTCGVTLNGLPPAVQAPYYLCISDNGADVDSGGNLIYTYHMKIGLWYSVEGIPTDRIYDNHFLTERFSTLLPSVKGIERDLIDHLHGDDTLATSLNEISNEDEQFYNAFYYKKKSPCSIETPKKPTNTDSKWIGFTMDFSGLSRVHLVNYTLPIYE